jgi:hypothetical protein
MRELGNRNMEDKAKGYKKPKAWQKADEPSSHYEEVIWQKER